MGGLLVSRARKTRRLGRCLFDARSGDHPQRPSPLIKGLSGVLLYKKVIILNFNPHRVDASFRTT